MTSIQIDCIRESDTFDLGSRIGHAIAGTTIIYLTGTLGAGKTRLVQAIASGLGIDSETVNSPTFTIMVPHQGRMTLLHVDAYRINDLDEAEQLGIEDWVQSGCTLIVEWAEKIEAILPPPDLRIEIEHLGESSRRFKINSTSDQGAQIVSQLSVSDD